MNQSEFEAGVAVHQRMMAALDNPVTLGVLTDWFGLGEVDPGGKEWTAVTYMRAYREMIKKTSRQRAMVIGETMGLILETLSEREDSRELLLVLTGVLNTVQAGFEEARKIYKPEEAFEVIFDEMDSHTFLESWRAAQFLANISYDFRVRNEKMGRAEFGWDNWIEETLKPRVAVYTAGEFNPYSD